MVNNIQYQLVRANWKNTCYVNTSVLKKEMKKIAEIYLEAVLRLKIKTPYRNARVNP